MKLFLPIVSTTLTRKGYEKIAKYLPEHQRDDPTKWLNDCAEVTFKNPKVQHMTMKGETYQIPPPFNVKILSWSYVNWTPRSNDVIVATFPKTGKNKCKHSDVI